MNISSLSIIQNHHYYYSSGGIYHFYRIKNPQTNNFNPLLILTRKNYYYYRRRIISAAHLDTTHRTRTRTRRRNHLRKKIQEQDQVPPSSPSIINITSLSSIPVLENQLETNTIDNHMNATIVNQHHHQILSIPNSPPSVLVFCAFLVFIAVTKTVTTTTQKASSTTTSRLEKQMLTRKLKARMKKSSHDTTTITTIPQMSPPQLDKQQLTNTILNSATDFSQLKEISISQDDINLTQLADHKTSNILDTQQLLQNKPTPAPAPAPAGRIITSVKEARQYLNNKKKEFNQLSNIPNPFDFSATSNDINLGDVSINSSNVKDENQECVNAKAGEELERVNRAKWIEDNFHEFQPIVDKIRAGFTDNYMLAKQKVKEDGDDIVSDLKMLQRDQTETEFEWMKDEKLREIVFQVRENELMGRDPFYLMDDQDKTLFFKGLEKKVEKESEKLRHLHEYLHSNIENLDYGADGISLYDPPEKIIPRWKGPPPASTMSQEFLDDYLHQRKALFAETLGNSDLVKSDPQDSLQSTNKTIESKNLKSSKTVIEGSDGSVKPGKKTGKEFWQHTKKWSRGFIDSYNAENDPETKAVMRDIGKDLDRWITEKEIQATADIMDKVPEKGKKFIAEKINKLKTEVEFFGPQAVVSKYSEFGEEEEIDYYWWLDLPFVLCIELYIEGDDDERIGFYSLEMAADLELDPKPHHIIAFEDAGDCKNFCYIIQAHMEMLGNGNAFVVPQLPKDTYQQAKTNGFNVTVIRKGELKLDVDQTLEEVEEKLVEIGSKIYHDKIMKGRNVNVNSVMKGVFGLSKPPKRSTSKKKLKKPTK